MNKNQMLKGIGTVMAIGGTAAAISSAMSGSNAAKRKMKKTAVKALKTMNNIMDGVQSML